MDTADVAYSLDLTKEQRKAAARWMVANVADYLDECGEVQSTALAEDCAEALNLYKPGTTAIIHDVFDLATVVPQ